MGLPRIEARKGWNRCERRNCRLSVMLGMLSFYSTKARGFVKSISKFSLKFRVKIFLESFKFLGIFWVSKHPIYPSALQAVPNLNKASVLSVETIFLQKSNPIVKLWPEIRVDKQFFQNISSKKQINFASFWNTHYSKQKLCALNENKFMSHLYPL